ncbi:hypothetical protein GOP47_0020590 [Adiantum capillus-veneris]|uniref:Uncharacterized protein n=1 Tax=Adiantum capillus-veneris TaxID=13818 RepID=A0A9D4U9N9_ADICA|nr:hypothetical protein GOP47_0020590 [Adiantum capillus-veneris]
MALMKKTTWTGLIILLIVLAHNIETVQSRDIPTSSQVSQQSMNLLTSTSAKLGKEIDERLADYSLPEPNNSHNPKHKGSLPLKQQGAP